jgi:TolB-like protein
VLPFKGAPVEIGNEELARDVAAELASELARSPEIHVVSTQSSFQFTAGQTPLSEIGRRLRSRYLVDGAVRRDAEQLRIIVQLLDSQSGQVMWSSSHTVDRTTLSNVQQVWVSRIAGTLQSKMSHFEERRAVTQPPKTLDVVVLTARAKSMMHRYSAEGVRESRRLLEQALSIDPEYAPAWAFLSLTNTIDFGLQLTGEWGVNRAPEILAQARRAVALQPDMPMGYEALTDAEGLFGNFNAALAAAQQCLRISPNDAMCFYALGVAQLRMGQVDLAARSFEQSLDRNPLPPTVLPAFYATALWASGRLEEAVKIADECLAKAPDFWRCRQDRIAALVELGRHAEAREEAARLRAQHPEMTSRQFALKWADAAAAFGERRSAAARAVGFP